MKTAVPLRTCPQCGAKFIPTHGRQRFCVPAHKQQFASINMQRGKVALPFLQVWNMRRSGDRAYALRQLVKMAGEWNAQDKASGRDPSLVVAERAALRWSHGDRSMAL